MTDEVAVVLPPPSVPNIQYPILCSGSALVALDALVLPCFSWSSDVSDALKRHEMLCLGCPTAHVAKSS